MILSGGEAANHTKSENVGTVYAQSVLLGV